MSQNGSQIPSSLTPTFPSIGEQILPTEFIESFWKTQQTTLLGLKDFFLLHILFKDFSSPLHKTRPLRTIKKLKFVKWSLRIHQTKYGKVSLFSSVSSEELQRSGSGIILNVYLHSTLQFQSTSTCTVSGRTFQPPSEMLL